MDTAQTLANRSVASTLEDSHERMSFIQLARQSAPVLVVFNGVNSALIVVLLCILGYASRTVLAIKGTAFTTANAFDVIFSWEGAFLILAAIILVSLYITLNLFAHLYFCKSLLDGEQLPFRVRARRATLKAFRSLPRFLRPTGVPTLLYIVLLAPLVGVSFSVGVTQSLFIPTFIMNVILSTPLFAAAYVLLVIAMIAIGVMHIFMFHGVLIDGYSIRKARRESRRIVRTYPLTLLKCVAKGFVFLASIVAILSLVFSLLYAILVQIGMAFPEEYHTGIAAMLLQGLAPTGDAIALTAYRAVCFLYAIIVAVTAVVLVLITGSGVILYSTHIYLWLSKAEIERDDKGKIIVPEEPTYIDPGRKRVYWSLVVQAPVIVIALVLVSLVLGFAYDYFIDTDPIKVVSHRLGGGATPENTLVGLEFAIAEGCYGAETDIQRTKDGYYVINHDNTFKRLAGVDAAPSDLTLDEIRELVLVDPNFPHVRTRVFTIEELLDKSKDRIKLFIELKGKTADRQMVDDVVRIVREKDAVDDVVLISLEYDCIAYAEETYPEFETGLLFFAQYGDVSLLPGDILLAEEKSATALLIQEIHYADREAGVWTANSRSGLKAVMGNRADYVITDRAVLAQAVQEELDNQSELEAITELVWGEYQSTTQTAEGEGGTIIAGRSTTIFAQAASTSQRLFHQSDIFIDSTSSHRLNSIIEKIKERKAKPWLQDVEVPDDPLADSRPEVDSANLLPVHTYVLESSHEVDGRQGVAVEGGTIWVSGSTSLSRYDSDWNLLSTNDTPFDEGYDKPVNHIGDIDVYNGEVYCGVELFQDGAASNIQIAVYDGETLELKRTFNFDPESSQDECSGICVDPSTSSVWMCAWTSSGRYLYRYDLESGTYLGRVQLHASPQWIQGVAFFDGSLYLTADDGDADYNEPDHIYRVTISEDATHATVALERTLNDVTREGEIEGISFTDDGRMLVLYNRGAHIILGMPSGFYEGYDHEIHEVFVYRVVK